MGQFADSVRISQRTSFSTNFDGLQGGNPEQLAFTTADDVGGLIESYLGSTDLSPLISDYVNQAILDAVSGIVGAGVTNYDPTTTGGTPVTTTTVTDANGNVVSSTTSSGQGVTSITGTAQQIVANSSIGDVTLSIPDSPLLPGVPSGNGFYARGGTQPSRYMGGVVAGAPTSGTWNQGDYVVGISNGTMWVCTVSGTPGTWSQVGQSAQPSSTVVAETGWGQIANQGTSSTTFSMGDHTHGTPPTPVTSLNYSGSGLSLSGTTGALTISNTGVVFLSTSGSGLNALTNATGSVTLSNTGVTSFASRTGAVTATAADIGAGTFPTGQFNFQSDVYIVGNTVSRTGVVAQNATANTGYVTLSPGDGTHTGYLSFFNYVSGSGIVRQGYIGFGTSTSGVIDTGTINYNAGNHDFGGTVNATTLQNNGHQVYYSGIGTASGVLGTDIRFDTITGGAGAGVGNLASQTVDSYNLKDGSITASKISLAAQQATIASGAGNNTANSFFRFATNSGQYIDPVTGQELSGMAAVNGASVVSDPQAYQNQAIKIFSTMTSGTVGQTFVGPAFFANDPGAGITLPAGIYNITVFVRVSANTSSSVACTFDAIIGSGSGTVAVTGSPSVNANQLSTTGYMGYSFAITTTGTPNDVRIRTKSGNLVDVYVSHITGIPVTATFTPYLASVFSPNVIATSATISSVSATSLVAGTIASDDIYLGTSGHVYAGNKLGGRVELNSAGVQAYQTANLITNGSFQSDAQGVGGSFSATGWTGIGVNLLSQESTWFQTTVGQWTAGTATTIARSTAVSAQSGSAVMSITTTSGSTAVAYTNNSRMTAVPGALYVGEAWFQGTSVTGTQSMQINCFVHINFYDAVGTLLSTTNGPRVYCFPGGWTQAHCTIQAPVTAATVELQVRILNQASGEVCYVSAPALFQTPVTAGDGQQLLTNGDFETTGAPWVAVTNCSIGVRTDVTTDPSPSWSGYKYLRIISTAAGNVAACPETWNVRPNNSYTFSAYYRSQSVARAVSVQLNYYDASNTFISQFTYSGTSTTTGWQRATVTGLAPSNARFAIIFFQFTATAAANEVHYVDAAKWEMGSSATAYIPRSYTNQIINSGFQTDLTSWGNVGTAAPTSSRITSNYIHGNSAAQINWATSSNSGTAGFANGSAMCYPNVVYTASVWLNATSTDSVLTVYAFPANLGGSTNAVTTISNANSVATAGVGWRRVWFTFSVSVSCYVQFQISPNANAAAGATCLVDAAQLELGFQMNPYVGGDITGFTYDRSTNLLPYANSDAADFEGGTTGGWTAGSNWTLANDATSGVVGTHSLKGTRSNTTLGNGYAAFTMNVSPNQIYTFHCWVKCSVSQTITLRASNTVSFYPQNAQYVVGTGYTHISLTFFTVPGDAQVTLFITDDNNATVATGTTVNIDAVSLEQKAYMGVYGNAGVGPNNVSNCVVPWPSVSMDMCFGQSANDFTPAQSGNHAALAGGNFNPNLLGHVYQGISTEAANQGSAGMTYGPITGLAANTQYTLSIWTYNGAATTKMVLDGPGVTTPVIGSFDPGTIGYGVWQRNYVTFTSSSTGGTVWLYVYNTWGAYANFGLDSVQLEAGTTPTTFTTNTNSSATTFTLANNGIMTLTNPSGARMILDPHYGIDFYSPSAVSQMHLDMVTGNASFAGTVTATAGAIGGWNINSNYISSGVVGTSQIALGASGYILVGSATTGNGLQLDSRTTGGIGYYMATFKANVPQFTVDFSGNVTLTGTITAASVVAGGALTAGTVTTDKLSVAAGVSDDLLVNGSFQEANGPNGSGIPLGWTTNYEATAGSNYTTYWDSTNGRSGGGCMVIANADNGSGTAAASMSIPVAPGDTYSINGYLMQSGASGGPFYVRVIFGTTYNFSRFGNGISVAPAFTVTTALNGNAGAASTGGYVDLVQGGSVAAQGVWYPVEGTVTVPAGASWMRLALYYWYGGSAGTRYGSFDDWKIRKQFTTTTIANGAVTADMIGAGTINASRYLLVGNPGGNQGININGAGYIDIKNGSGEIILDGRSGQWPFVVKQGATNLLYLDNSGNLNVKGTVTAGSAVLADTVRSQAAPGTANSWALQNDYAYRVWNSSGTQVVLIDMNGNATFSGNLTIAGQSYLTGTLNLTGTGTLISSSNFTVSTNGLINATSATLGSATINGATTLSGTVSVGATLTVSGTIQSSTSVGSSGNGYRLSTSGLEFYSGTTRNFYVDMSGNLTSNAGTLTGLNINAGTITGATIQTATSGDRVVISSSTLDRVYFYGSGIGTPSYIRTFASSGSVNNLYLAASAGFGDALLSLNSAGSSVASNATLSATTIFLTASSSALIQNHGLNTSGSNSVNLLNSWERRRNTVSRSGVSSVTTTLTYTGSFASRPVVTATSDMVSSPQSSSDVVSLYGSSTTGTSAYLRDTDNTARTMSNDINFWVCI